VGKSKKKIINKKAEMRVKIKMGIFGERSFPESNDTPAGWLCGATIPISDQLPWSHDMLRGKVKDWNLEIGRVLCGDIDCGVC